MSKYLLTYLPSSPLSASIFEGRPSVKNLQSLVSTHKIIIGVDTVELIFGLLDREVVKLACFLWSHSQTALTATGVGDSWNDCQRC